MKTYELTYIISPELTTDTAQALSAEINDFLQKNTGVILKSSLPTPKTLSYKIRKQTAGFQTTLEFNIEPEKVKEVEEKLKKDSRVLRHAILIKNPAKANRKERKPRKPAEIIAEASAPTILVEKKEKTGEKKVELKNLEEKLEEILKE